MATTIASSSRVAGVEIPGYLAGTWKLDPVHSDLSFSVRHLMVSKVRGHFRNFDAEIVTGEDPLGSSVVASVDLSSIDTDNADRDAHIRSTDFFDVERFPTMTYRSSGVRSDGDGLVLDGELTLHGVTRSVPLQLEVNGFVASPFGDTRAGFSARTEISRRDFGIDLDMPLEGGGVVVGDRIQVSIEIEAILEQ
jgi:polyisoprenoid-binding protein YceI